MAERTQQGLWPSLLLWLGLQSTPSCPWEGPNLGRAANVRFPARP